MSNMTSQISTSEMISLFRRVEEEISRERGDFTLFGLFERLDIHEEYDLVIAAPWLKDDRTSTNLIFDLVRASIGHDKWFGKIGLFMIVPENGPFAAAVHEALPNGPVRHDFKRLTNFFYDGEIIRDGVVITSVEPAAKAGTPKRRAKSAEPVAA